MRSKRVTKLLACAVATSMCFGAVPVFAAATGTPGRADNKTKGDFTMNVGIAGATLSVNVPTNLNVKINPMHAATGSTVSAQEIASDEFIVSNNTTTDDGTGVDVMCKVVTQVTAKKEGVQLTYTNFTSDANSKTKKAYMQVAPALASTGLSGNNYAAPNTVGNATVTTVKSTYEQKIDKPTSTGAGLGGFAIVGKANVGADWADSDFTVALSYDLKAAATGSSALSIPATSAMTAVAASAITSDVPVLANTVLTGAVLGDAKVTHVQVHSPEGLVEDTLLAADDERLKITYEDDTTTSGTQKCSVAFAANCVLLRNFTTNFKGKTFDLLVCLSDGRRIVVTMPIAAS